MPHVLFAAAEPSPESTIKMDLPILVGENQWVAPTVLGEDDVKIYKRIFFLQEKGKWSESKKLIGKLNNKILMGHVAAQKYLHPTKYRSKYVELLQWLRKYADHPQARRIYALALRRRPANWKMPPGPVGRVLRGNGALEKRKADISYKSSVKRSKRDRRQVLVFQKEMRRLIHKGWPTGAYKKLSSSLYKRTLDPVEISMARAEIAHGYFIFGKDRLALSLAKKSLSKHSEWAPIAAWVAGLSSWRLNDISQAASFFEILGGHSRAEPDLRAAGAFWASRGHLINHRPKESSKWLQKASLIPGSFYGVLARRALGLSVGLDLGELVDKDDFSTKLVRFPRGRRVAALLQLARNGEAERELRGLFYSLPDKFKISLMAFASANRMPGLAMRSAGIVRKNGGAPYYPGLYPLPQWNIPKDISIDPALIYAIVRQESQFNVRAKSARGARGLMQLMPRTAAAIGKNNLFRKGKGRDALFNPRINIRLGGKYLRHLMRGHIESRNLFKTLAAYNAGPGKLSRWERSIDYQEDPLMFIESIPSPETRHFIEQVLLGLWIYRFRLDEPAPTLRHLAEGIWPKYESVSGQTMGRIDNARN
ncbi:MAG: lytic murein transglycosylase [Rhodospirillaceae bacterium]|nr:lytic murein transglycosylase [Rhodospirillaceae bacterium]|tara:strand:- start:6150 stop:7931 length:1782 start_codon:yes stop_codon:yes gene_type:complete